MMKQEVFRARGVLQGLNINLFAGESLGVYGMSNSGKTALLDLVEGRVRPHTGVLFLEGAIAPVGSREGFAARISSQSALVDGCPVWENLLVIRGHRRKKLALRPALLRRQVTALLADAGLKLDVDALVGDLSDAQRYMVEIIKAWLMDVRVILVDDFSSDFTAEETARLRFLMHKIKEEGVSFLITSCRLEALRTCTDRIAFLQAGRVVKTIANTPENQRAIDSVMAVLFPDSDIEKQPTPTVGRQLCNAHFKMEGDASLALQMHSGEIIAVVDSTGERLAVLQNRLKNQKEVLSLDHPPAPSGPHNAANGHKRGSMFTDFSLDDLVVEELSPVDNLCLGLFDRLSTTGVIRHRRMRNVAREFGTWLGSDALLERADCTGISQQDKAAIMMYRLLLHNPAVLVGWIPSLSMDLLVYRVVKRGLLELAQNGTAVCLLLDDVELLDDFADRYVLVTKKDVQENVSYSAITAAL